MHAALPTAGSATVQKQRGHGGWPFRPHQLPAIPKTQPQATAYDAVPVYLPAFAEQDGVSPQSPGEAATHGPPRPCRRSRTVIQPWQPPAVYATTMMVPCM